ncbi:MAG TPA: hypothetical protein VMC10_04595 [Stellaceae bacterium]|nr:hypothetical protein [Stellaceae bacterium]
MPAALPASDPASEIAAEAPPAADWMATALASYSYRADFSLASLREIDRFFDENAPGGKPIRDALLGEDLPRRLFGLGAYTGEVIRRRCGGLWTGNDADPEAPFNLALRLQQGSTIWPMQRMMKRLTNGPEDSVYFYGYVAVREARRQSALRHFWAAVEWIGRRPCVLRRRR